MPFDREKGELLGELGPDFIIAPLSKWTGTGLPEDAGKMAAAAFREAGALYPIEITEDDVLIQEYPRLHKVVFLFQRKIMGKEHFYHCTFDLPPKMVAELRATGKWGRLN